METKEYIGRQFTISNYPGVYAIVRRVDDTFVLQHPALTTSVSIDKELLLRGIAEGNIRMIPIANKEEVVPVKQTNLFNFDDL